MVYIFKETSPLNIGWNRFKQQHLEFVEKSYHVL